MRIAVIGSWRESDRRDWELQDEKGFREAAELLGQKLIGLGHSLVVGSDGHDTADYLAARGAAAAAADDSAKRIHILAPRQKRQLFAQLHAQHPRLFVEHSIPADDWAPAKVFQVRYADAVAILAGAQASRQAGLTAAVSGKRLVCIGGFGGAARALNDLFMRSGERWNGNVPDLDTIGLLQTGWNSVLMDDVLSALRALGKPKILIVHGRAEDRDDLKRYLRDVKGLPEPIVLVDLKTASNVILQKFEELASDVDAAIALCTPDDVGFLADGAHTNRVLEPRARQNVWLEIGWFWGRLGLRRVLILTRGDVGVPSDLDGVERYQYEQRPQERELEIDAFLSGVGATISAGGRP